MKESDHFPEGMDLHGLAFQACQSICFPSVDNLIFSPHITPISALDQRHLEYLQQQGLLPYILFEGFILYRLQDMQAFWYAIFGDYPQVWHHLYRCLIKGKARTLIDSAGSYYYESYRQILFPSYGKADSSVDLNSPESLRLSKIKAYLEEIGPEFGQQLLIPSMEYVDVKTWWKHGVWHLDYLDI